MLYSTAIFPEGTLPSRSKRGGPNSSVTGFGAHQRDWGSSLETLLGGPATTSPPRPSPKPQSENKPEAPVNARLLFHQRESPCGASAN